MMATSPTWKYFLGNGRSEPLAKMPSAPAWRTFMSDEDFEQEKEQSDTRWDKVQELAKKDIRGKERGESFRLEDAYEYVFNAVNAAIHLRRPLLVTGKPGSGKTSLAYAIAYELKLGIVLEWAVNTRSILKDALYQYDAVARLQDVQIDPKNRRPLGEYLSLGSVGTAFLPSHLPRVLLIDEIDKCDINLPNDLLNLFEEGSYVIPELVRRKKENAEVDVSTVDRDVPAKVKEGRVVCREFPIIIMTSNGERDFPPAFLRRCIRLKMPDPSQNPIALERIVTAHLSKGQNDEQWQQIQSEITKQVNDFVTKSVEQTADIATDQLLNVVYLLTREVSFDDQEAEKIKEILLKGLSEED